MTQDGIPPLDDAKRRAIGRKHLAKALIKAIPKVGDIINEMVFERAKSEADAQDKAKIDAILHTLVSQGEAQNTDLGDLLLRVDQQSFQMQEVKDALIALAHYFLDQTDTTTTAQIETATQRALPGYTPGDTQSDVVGTLDRYTLRKAMEKGLTPPQLQVLLRDIPGATDWVPASAAKAEQISSLLEWAESDDGPGLDKIYAYVKREYDRFEVYP